MRNARSVVLLMTAVFPALPQTQTSGTAGTVTGVVSDPDGAVVPGAKVAISNAASRFQRDGTTDGTGAFQFNNVPPNPYHLVVTSAGFQPAQRDIAVRGNVPVAVTVQLELAGGTTTLEVHSDASDAIENVPTAHVDLDADLFSKLPRQSVGSGISDVLTLAAPGVVADSNGFFHPLGDHAETGFSVDNQPVTDQQGKQFSTQLPLNAIQSMEVISGSAPAEYGDKTSLVVNATTRSGLGAPRAFGAFTPYWGSFGTPGENASLGFGKAKFGNFTAFNVSRSGRYLDAPEFTPMHAIGNNQQFFDRADWQPDSADTLRLNVSLARAWFQIPNTYDQQFAGQDQRQRIVSFNISPGWIRILNPVTVLTITPYFRNDQVAYAPSRDPLSDLPATVTSKRRLTSAGVRGDVSYSHGIHNAKIGVQVYHTFLTEHFGLGVTDPLFNAPCVTADGDEPVAGHRPRECGTAGLGENPDFQPGLLPFDLTRGGVLFRFRGHTDIKQVAAFLQDQITLGNLSISVGLRGDSYQGLTGAHGVEPRAGISYVRKKWGTVFRASYSRFFETPYNENLILSSSTGAGGLATNVLGAAASKPLEPGRRNQYNAGFEQGAGRHLMIDFDYFWKYTDNAFDFDTLFNTPITFPIEWRKSKIDGFAARLNLVNFGGFSAFTVMGHTRARFFGPENGGIIFNSPVGATVFRIDHDQAFEQTTALRYQHKRNGPWISFTWRYDSGQVTGQVADRDAALALDGDRQAAIGVRCGNRAATVFQPVTECPAGDFHTALIRIPPDGTHNADTNPTRISPRNLLDAGAGTDNLMGGDRFRVTLQFTASNLTNQAALYNFLSTFSGTHFVAPRTYRVELGFVF